MPPRGHGWNWVPDQRFAFVVAAIVWTLIGLMIVPDGFDYAKLGPANPTTLGIYQLFQSASVGASGLPVPQDIGLSSGSAGSRMLWIFLVVAGAALIVRRALLASLVTRWVNPFMLAFALLALASIAWSIEPEITMRRCIRVVAVLFVAYALVLSNWHALRFQNVVRPAVTLVLLGSIAFGLWQPDLAIHREASYELVDAWHGLANHKNTLGALACIGVIFWFHGWISKEVSGWRAIAGVAIAGTCLILSRSSTSLVVALFSVCFLALMQKGPLFMRPVMPYLVALFIGALLVYSLAILRIIPGLDVLLKPIIVLTGKDMSFTGRSDIWALLIEQIRYDKMLGTGLGAYWIGAVPWSPSFEMMSRVHFYPGSAHNGYLEVTKDLGFVGLACLAGFLIVYVSQSLRLLRVAPAQGSLFLALFLQQALTNLSESHWFYVQSVGFVIMTLASFSLARALLELRLREYFGEPAVTETQEATHARA